MTVTVDGQGLASTKLMAAGSLPPLALTDQGHCHEVFEIERLESMGVQSSDASAVGTVTASGPGEAAAVTVAQRSRCLEDFTQQLSKHGGPCQYLEKVEKVEFGLWLWHTFPESDLHMYHYRANLPEISEEDVANTFPTVVHVAALGFDKLCSMKPPPGQSHSLELLEQYLIDGFDTTGAETGPLLVLQHALAPMNLPDLWNDKIAGQALPPFSLGYLKGMARSSTLMFLLHRFFCMKINIATDWPHLWKSVLAIHVHHVKQKSRMEECLQNMKMSVRGSLRKPNNTLQCVVMIQQLQSMGATTDYMSFVRRWNTMAATSHQIVGKRLTTLKLLFEQAPAEPHLSICF